MLTELKGFELSALPWPAELLPHVYALTTDGNPHRPAAGATLAQAAPFSLYRILERLDAREEARAEAQG